jgi:LysM repeat protein
MRRIFILIGILACAVFSATAQEAAITGQSVVHTVTYGDTLFRIAQRYGVTVDDIARENSIAYTWNIQIGQKLTIPGLTMPSGDDVDNPLLAGTPIEHIVRPGETLNSIAQRYGVSMNTISLANQIGDPNLIKSGQKLNIWTTQAVAAAEANTPAEVAAVAAEIEVPFTHVVRRGETLGVISRNYGISLGELVRANSISNPDRVLVGDVLVIPGRIAPATIGTSAEALAAATPPKATIAVGKQVVVDLSEQRVYAFEDGVLVFTAIVSTGLPATPTVLGDYKIYLRYESQTMSGPGYYLPGVQWVQYFYSGYGLHGTYWHENFGQPMSHGCVNLRNEDALWLYQWATIGTPVHVKM